MKSLWRLVSYSGDRRWQEHPVINLTSKRVFIHDDPNDVQPSLWSLDRAALERLGSVFHNPRKTTGGKFFYTDDGKAAFEKEQAERYRIQQEGLANLPPDENEQ